MSRQRLEHGAVVLLGDLRLRLRVNPRARRISVRVDTAGGEAVVVAPSARALPQALAFAQSREAWIAARLSGRPEPLALRPGGGVPLRGAPVPLIGAGGAGAARLTAEGIAAGGEGEAFARRVVRLLKREALADSAAAVRRHAQVLGLPAPAVAVMEARTRWGSCTPARGRVRLNWRLILAPPTVLDYVAAHEAAHLVHADHSPAFWAVVTKLYGDPSAARAWLRREGAALHAIG